VNGTLVWENVTKEMMNGKIVLARHADPFDVRILNLTKGATPLAVISIGVVELPGNGMFQNLDFKNALPYPWVEMGLTDGNSLIPIAVNGSYNITVNDDGVNVWRDFFESGAMIVFQVLVIGSNLALLIIIVYVFINISQISKQWIHIVGISLEFLGCLARVFFYIDPSGAYRVLPTSISAPFFYACFPFTLMNCLLMSLYFQETLRAKQLKVYYFITRTQWLFYTVVGILLVLIILIPATRFLTAFDVIRTIVIIGYITVSVCVVVLYTVTAIQLFETLRGNLKGRIKKSKRRLLAIRFILTASCLVAMIFIMIFSRFLRTPATVGIAGSILICAITSVGIVNGISLVILNSKKGKTTGETAKTKDKDTKTSTTGGHTRKDDDDDDKEKSSHELEDNEDKSGELESSKKEAKSKSSVEVESSEKKS
jgi:hypothetical protein